MNWYIYMCMCVYIYIYIYIYIHACVCESSSHVWLSATPWTVACQAPLSMEFSRQEYWSGLPFPSPGDLPDPGIKPASPCIPMPSALAGGSFTTSTTWGVPINIYVYVSVFFSFYWLSLGHQKADHTPVLGQWNSLGEILFLWVDRKKAKD